MRCRVRLLFCLVLPVGSDAGLGNTIHGSPVVPPEALRELPRGPLVASVAGAGPRAKIRAALAELGYRESRDFVCAA